MKNKHNCENCNFRTYYDKKPKSFLGRIWLWHATWCPGFKKYITSRPDDQRVELAKRYGLKKYQD